LDVDEAIKLLQAIKELETSSKKTVTAARSVGKKTARVAKKIKRAPSAYNQYMKKQLAILKKKHPKTSHTVLFKRAAKSWNRSAERKRSMK
jgi:hypothetical protein